MPSIDRQNKLIAAEDWQKIYQSYKNADFQSYDFDNIRRTLISYLRENYPEDFNDYIESSEYLALIDSIAFISQSIAYRYDMNSRDNFLELAERRDSVLRLARMLSYNAKRNQAAAGLLKFTAVSTTESIFDSSGRDLAGQTILWNDSANANWFEQFIKVINCALPSSGKVGSPVDKSIIAGVITEQYKISGINTAVPLFGFSKSVDGRSTDFEVVSSTFAETQDIYEEPPLPGNNFAFLYRNDGSGNPSSNTGFFAYFKQGNLREYTFTINRPSANEIIDVDLPNINNSDVWLYKLDGKGNELELWDKVDSTAGNNVIYNSLSKDKRNVYSVLSQNNDTIRLSFSDGVFGNLPQGTFKVYVRTSNGLSYAIKPADLNGIILSLPYMSSLGTQEVLKVTLSLKYTVNNSSSTETSDSIKKNAPAAYYSQGRMITGEDYNVLPLTVNQEIVKVKSVNRISAGISRYFDLKDTSGKYSLTNLFSTDGILYKDNFNSYATFTPTSKVSIENAVLNIISPMLSSRSIKDFYLDNFSYVKVDNIRVAFSQTTNDTNYTTGAIIGIDDNIMKRVGDYTVSNLKFISPGAAIRFIPPTGYTFNEKNELILGNTGKLYIWSKVIRIVGDGTINSGTLDTGYGPISFNDTVPTGAILEAVVPSFTSSLSDEVYTKLIDLIYSKKQFGLRYDQSTISWKIISDINIDRKSNFSLGKTGDQTSQFLDSSWLILAETDGHSYKLTARGTRYVFESEKEIRFFFDANSKIYDSTLGKTIKDTITVLGINTTPDAFTPISRDIIWEIVDDYKGSDGYIDTKKISVSFADTDDDGIVDDPDVFKLIVNPSVNKSRKFIFQKRKQSPDGVTDYQYIDNSNGLILVFNAENEINISTLNDGQLVYLINSNVVKTFVKSSSRFIVNSEYKGFVGRDKIKFQYVHAAESSARIDPSASNIIDVFMLTKTYDTQYRQWLSGDLQSRPLPPSSDSLYTNFGNLLNSVKSISDEVIYHPVKYKNLFGSRADSSLQATIKIVKTQGISVSDNDIKTGVIDAINEFFSIENWEFGDTFYFAELSTFVMQRMSPKISNIVIVPKQQNLNFGSLYEIKSNSDEIFASSATVDEIEVISEITATQIKAAGQIVVNTISATNNIASA